MRIYLTADLHYGVRESFDRLTDALAEALLEEARPGDVLVIAGDVACGDGRGLEACLALFARFPGPRALVPGNHDIWSSLADGPGSRVLYETRLPPVAARHGFHVLDRGPLPIGGGVALAGCYGGYDFRLADLSPLSAAEREEVEEAWRTGHFRHAFWNDYRFTWDEGPEPWDHAGFAREMADRFAHHLARLEQDPGIQEIVAVTHTGAEVDQVKDHPRGLGRPLVGNLWFRGLSGSRAVGRAVAAAPKVRLHACGHTHHERDVRGPGGRRYINIGCDYDRKRWVRYAPASGEVVWGPWFGDGDASGEDGG